VLADRLDAAAHRRPLPWTIAMAFRGRGLLAPAQGDIANALNQLDRALAVYDTCLAMPFDPRPVRAARPTAGPAMG
jgi:hypothetical protein